MIIYRFTDDDLPVAVSSVALDDDGSDWWVGTQKCFAVVALAGVLAATSLSTAIASTLQWQDEIPAGSLHGQPDEDFWKNAVAPMPGANIYPQQWTFDSQEPSGNLHGQPDEDFWNNPVAPILGVNRWPQQFDFDIQEPSGSLFGVPEESDWKNPVPPSVVSYLFPYPFLFDDQVVVGPVVTITAPTIDNRLHLGVDPSSEHGVSWTPSLGTRFG